MPTYSYACTECDNRFDAVQAFTDDALTTCPQCSGRLRKLFNSVGVVFKGSGFYRNDSRDSGKAAAKTPSNGSDSGGSAASSETSSKPEKPSGKDSSSSGSTSSSTSGSSAPAAASN